MIDLMDRHSSWGKPFQTLWITTKKYGSVAVHANRTTRTSPGHPSQLSEQIDYPGPPIPIIRLEQGQSGTTRPKRQLYTQCTVGQKANAEHQHHVWRHDHILVFYRYGGLQLAVRDQSKTRRNMHWLQIHWFVQIIVTFSWFQATLT